MTRLLATTVALCTGAGLLLYGASSAAANTVALTGDGPVIIQTTPGVAQPPRDMGSQPGMTPQTCPTDPTYSTWGGIGTFVGDPSRIVRGMGPEVLSMQVTHTDTTTGTFSDTTGVSVSGIIFSAHTDISGGIALSVAAGTTFGASYTPPSGRLGWLQWGNWGWHYYWSYGHYAGCVWVTKNGSANSPVVTGKGFNHGYA